MYTYLPLFLFVFIRITLCKIIHLFKKNHLSGVLTDKVAMVKKKFGYPSPLYQLLSECLFIGVYYHVKLFSKRITNNFKKASEVTQLTYHYALIN